MNGFEAIRLVINNLAGDGLMIHANGAVSHESLFCQDTTKFFAQLAQWPWPFQWPG